MNRHRQFSQGGRGHGGNIHLLSRLSGNSSPIIDFSANINPFGPPEWLRRRINRELSQVVHYPDPDCHAFVEAIASHYDVDPATIVAGNGTTELLYALPRVIPCKRAVIPVPSYIDYQKVMERHGVPVHAPMLAAEDGFTLDGDTLAGEIDNEDLVIVGSPNNPTGSLVKHDDIIRLADDFAKTWFVIDEAFLDFVEDGQSVAGRRENIITLNSLTKFYALAGLRLGFGTFPKEIAGKLRELLPPWTVNTLAQAVGKHLFEDRQYRQRSLTYIKEVKSRFLARLAEINDIRVFPSAANYLLVRIESELTAGELAENLLDEKIAIRTCGNYQGLDEHYFRVAVRTEEENDRLISALANQLGSRNRQRSHRPKSAKTLMIQGTSSNAGKSVLVAALCRILIQEGMRVAPFKAQNMSLNSYVTHDGLEMGRAQVVQAQACRLDPDVRMNPVLLKPNSDVGSQVIVRGKPVGNMTVGQYVEYKEKAGKEAFSCFDSLAADYDVVVLEGAGSPGEVNLKHHDIVNMQMARYAKSPVLLVGDIDRGGVYASFIGTMDVLEEWERQLVAGFLVNRFRGDATLLQSAHSYIYEYTGKNVLGTIPYISDLGIPEEDSVSFKAGGLRRPRPATDHVEIALINLPHISNFTDIEPFLDEPDVYLNIVDHIGQLGAPDAIILPGSKNVMGDIEYLLRSDIGGAVVQRAGEGCEIVGICGGYQILGKSVADPYCIESGGETRSGLGLLDIETSLAKDKTLRRRSGCHIGSGLSVYGYEIHHGISKGSVEPLLRFQDEATCGTQHQKLPVWGAYLHGIFDADTFRRWFIDSLREKKGLSRLDRIVAPYNLENAFDALADTVRRSTDMEAIYSLLGE